jgi:hypothetical protein
MGGQNVTEKLGSAEDVTNVNPYTSQLWNNLQGLQSGFTANMGNYAPTNNVASLEGVLPGIQSISNSLISPYGTSLMNTADILGQSAMRGVASQYSNAGAVNSGAALSAMARGYAEPVSQAVTNIAQMQSNLGGGLASSVLGQMGSAYGTQAGLLSNVLGLQGNLGQAEWWQPTYSSYYQPSGFEQLLGGLGGVLGLGTGALRLATGLQSSSGTTSKDSGTT